LTITPLGERILSRSSTIRSSSRPLCFGLIGLASDVQGGQKAARRQRPELLASHANADFGIGDHLASRTP